MPIKIAYIVRPAAGGMVSHLTGLISKLNRDEFEPILIGPIGFELEEALRAKDVELFDIAIADRVKIPKDLKSILSIASVLRKTKPDIVHIHGNKAAAVGIPAAFLAGKKRIVLTVHNFLSQAEKSKVWGMLLRRADSIIAISEAVKKEVVANAKIDPEKVNVIHNGIDVATWKMPQKGSMREKFSISEEGFVMGAMGRMVPWKGFAVFIEALCEFLPKHDDSFGLIAGDGPMLQELKGMVDAKGLGDRVVFTGFLADPDSFFADIDVFVFPSTNEPFGIALLEAMASQRPVIASSSDSAGEILDESCAILVEPGKPDSLVLALEKIHSDRQSAFSMVQKARKIVEERFSLSVMSEKTQRIYDQLVTGDS